MRETARSIKIIIAYLYLFIYTMCIQKSEKKEVIIGNILVKQQNAWNYINLCNIQAYAFKIW